MNRTIRFYRRDQEDRILSLERCFFEARHGRVALALDRLLDAKEEFPDDAEILHAEGVFRRDHLGQGVAAAAAFREAHRLNPSHPLAAYHAATTSTDYEEAQHWVEIALLLTPTDEATLDLRRTFEGAQRECVPFTDLLITKAGHLQKDSSDDKGESAAALDLALGAFQGDRAVRKALHWNRATLLREIDRVAHARAEASGYHLLGLDRLALRDAVRELVAALELDPYDPENWNFRAAWCLMLEEFEEAVQAAEHASELRPYGYAKPHQNRAIALYRLGRFQEARNALATAMEVAQGAGAWEDVQQLKALALDFDRVHTLESLHAHLTLTLHRARHYSETEESRGGKMDSKENLETLVDGFLKRARHLVPLSTPKLVPLLAELLSYASPETCFWVNAFLARHSKELEEDFMHAALLLTGQAKGTLQQDAARLMVLFNLAVPEGDAMRWMYRLGVLEPKAAGAANFESADAALRLALRRIHPDLPTLVAVQPPVDASGIQRAKQVLLPRLNGQSSEYIPRTSVPFSSHDGQRTGVDVSILWAVFLAGLGCIGFGLLVAMLLPTMASLDAVMQSAVNGPWVIDLNAYTIEMMAVFLLLGLVLFTQGYLVALGRPDMGFPLPDAQSPGWGNITVGESAVVIQLAFSGLVLAVLVCVFIAPSIMPPNLAPRPTWVRTVIWAVAGAFSGGWTARNVIKAYRSR